MREENQRSYRKDFHFARQQFLRRRWRRPWCLSGKPMISTLVPIYSTVLPRHLVTQHNIIYKMAYYTFGIFAFGLSKKIWLSRISAFQCPKKSTDLGIVKDWKEVEDVFFYSLLLRWVFFTVYFSKSQMNWGEN